MCAYACGCVCVCSVPCVVTFRGLREQSNLWVIGWARTKQTLHVTHRQGIDMGCQGFSLAVAKSEPREFLHFGHKVSDQGGVVVSVLEELKTPPLTEPDSKLTTSSKSWTSTMWFEINTTFISLLTPHYKPQMSWWFHFSLINTRSLSACLGGGRHFLRYAAPNVSKILLYSDFGGFSITSS